MTSLRIPFLTVAAVVFLLLSEIPAADGQLRWPRQRKQEIEVRLVALAEAYPRSSVFANDEVFVAEQELSKEESRFIKLVYDFLPYEPPLSDSGLNYSLVHKVQAVRDSTCDESLWQMRSLMESGGAPSSRIRRGNMRRKVRLKIWTGGKRAYAVTAPVRTITKKLNISQLTRYPISWRPASVLFMLDSD